MKIALARYAEALTVYDWHRHPAEWAMCQNQIGKLYLDLSDGIDLLEKERILLHYKMVLALINKGNWPELWHKSHLELSLLYRKYAMFSENEEDSSMAEEHYRMAFDLDRKKDPAFYDLMKSIYDVYTRFFELQLEMRQTKERS